MDWDGRRQVDRSVRSAAAILVYLAVTTAPAAGQDFRPMVDEEARLLVAPSVLAGEDAQRSVANDGFVRYELWSIPFRTNRPFFHLLLREVLRGSPVANPSTLEEIVAQFLGGRTSTVVWQDGGDLQTGLGDATFRMFQLAGFGCAGFVVDYDVGPADRTPRAVEGLYCDPAVDRLSFVDIERTLNGIGVTGLHAP